MAEKTSDSFMGQYRQMAEQSPVGQSLDNAVRQYIQEGKVGNQPEHPMAGMIGAIARHDAVSSHLDNIYQRGRMNYLEFADKANSIIRAAEKGKAEAKGAQAEANQKMFASAKAAKEAGYEVKFYVPNAPGGAYSTEAYAKMAEKSPVAPAVGYRTGRQPQAPAASVQQYAQPAPAYSPKIAAKKGARTPSITPQAAPTTPSAPVAPQYQPEDGDEFVSVAGYSDKTTKEGKKPFSLFGRRKAQREAQKKETYTPETGAERVKRLEGELDSLGKRADALDRLKSQASTEPTIDLSQYSQGNAPIVLGEAAEGEVDVTVAEELEISDIEHPLVIEEHTPPQVIGYFDSLMKDQVPPEAEVRIGSVPNGPRYDFNPVEQILNVRVGDEEPVRYTGNEASEMYDQLSSLPGARESLPFPTEKPAAAEIPSAERIDLVEGQPPQYAEPAANETTDSIKMLTEAGAQEESKAPEPYYNQDWFKRLARLSGSPTREEALGSPEGTQSAGRPMRRRPN